MKAELEIRDALREGDSVEDKVKRIQKFMNWDKKKLTEAIMKYGTSTDTQRASVIKEFWGGNLSGSERGSR